MKLNLSIEYRKTADLIPYARNARTHNEAQVQQIAASIKEFGFNNPVAVDTEGMILCGHGRVLAAQKLGLNEVPTVCLSHLSEVQKKAYILADNKLALNAEWDNDMLKLELEELNEEKFDLDITGFSAGELDDIIGEQKSYLDDITEENFNNINELAERESFVISFTFDKQQEDVIKKYVKDTGKDVIAAMITEQAMGIR